MVFIFSLTLLILLFGLTRRLQAGQDSDFFYDLSEGERYSHKWGYSDTRFEFEDPRTVRVTGSRYPLAGYSMPYLIPFLKCSMVSGI